MNDNTPKPPPRLPDFIFLLSTHETRQLACDVAEKLYGLEPQLLVWDFLSPIHDGLAMMLDVDYGMDMGSPKQITSTMQDHINSLEAWFNTEFGDHYLGIHAWTNCMEQRAVSDSPILYRDAMWTHLRLFIKNLVLKDYLIVRLNNSVGSGLVEIQSRVISFDDTPTADAVVAAIIKAA